MIDSPVISGLMVIMALLPLFDAFDRLFARTAMRIDGSNGAVLWPDRWIAWGIIYNVQLLPGPPREIRFFHLYLPIRTWGLISAPWTPPNARVYGLRGHRLQWIERCTDNPYLGWRIEPSLNS
jgi:hypothetical protein